MRERGGAGALALAFSNLAKNTIQMVTLSFFFIFFLFIFLFLPYTTSNPICDSYIICGSGSPNIQFPFWLRDRNPGQRCGYPGFELSCDNDKALLNIPNSGNFVVTSISSEDILIDDTEGCLPRRFLTQNVSLTGTPFKWGEDYTLQNFIVLKCNSSIELLALDLIRVPCPSSFYNSHFIALFPNNKDYKTDERMNSSCQMISPAWIPWSNSRPWGIDGGIELTWSEPADCRNCNPYYEQCGFLGNTGLNVTCYPRNTSRNKKVAVGGKSSIEILQWEPHDASNLGIYRQQPQASLELPTSNAPQTPIFAVAAVGLDRSIIETYPKTEVSESGALPDPNDNVCSICLSEYQPKEILRSIPNCNHYFHLNCLDEWLRMNATCPLCRNLPGRSLSVFSTS
ncbi:hypothetical protein L6164_037087 [Bauhinia variegata]|uniref:Uncharacterized protein n=1 Tax=Bauhinia variegata TaxID=167791 RepID=A0ACB9KJ00_BAUVA|nr:hypothetical protein L6164_037087 [Bauhinia variegata]